MWDGGRIDGCEVRNFISIDTPFISSTLVESDTQNTHMNFFTLPLFSSMAIKLHPVAPLLPLTPVITYSLYMS